MNAAKGIRGIFCFDPDVYPVNFAFIDGRISEDSFREEHQAAYEQMKEESKRAEVKAGNESSVISTEDNRSEERRVGKECRL